MTPIGSNLVLLATRRFGPCHPAGYKTLSPIRSPLMVNSDGYCRVMLGLLDTVETYLAPVRKDFSFTNSAGVKTNRRARAPLLYTLDPLTLDDVLISPTTACNASAGAYSPQGARWGNGVPLGTFNVLEIGNDIIASYGGDGAGHDCSRFNKFTGARVPFSTSMPANWLGILSIGPNGEIVNAGADNTYRMPIEPSPTVQTSSELFKVEAITYGYRITRTEAGKATVETVNLGFNPGKITHVTTANGLLFVQSVIDMDVIISVFKGNAFKAFTLPRLPASGYVPATPIDMNLGEPGTIGSGFGIEITPLKIAQPDPTQTDSYAVDPKFRHAYLFPVVDGQAFVGVTHAYMDQHGADPADLRLWLFPVAWTEPCTRKNIPRVIGEPIAIRNVGKAASGLYRIDFDVSAAMAAALARGEKTIAFCLEGVAPPHYSKSKVFLIDRTRLVAASGAAPVEPPPVVEPPATSLAPVYSEVGTWTPSSLGGRYSQNKGSTAKWAFTPPPGTYEVHAKWSTHANRASNASYTVGDTVVRVDQRTGGTAKLATVTVTGNLVVSLGDSANGVVVAWDVWVNKIN